MSESLVYGHNPLEKIVGIHPFEGNKMRIYVRKDTSLETIEYNFYPFFFLSDIKYLENFKKKYYKKKLDGNNFFQYLVAFDKWSDMWECIHRILALYNKSNQTRASSYEDLPIIHLLPDKQTQFLMQSGITLFKNMEFDEIHRLQISIESASSIGRKSNDQRKEFEKIHTICITDNRGYNAILGLKEKSEKAIIEKLTRILTKLDPDIIEGFNLHEDIFQFILFKCEQYEINFTIGRDGTVPTTMEYPLHSKESFQKIKYTVSGRNLVDITDLLQDYDPYQRIFHTFDLKLIAEHFQLESAKNIDTISDSAELAVEKNKLVKHISDLLLPSFIEQAKIFPLNFSKILDLAPSQKIEALFLREYVKQKYSIPSPQPPKQISGGYTDLYFIGVFENVYYIDVESMYPNLMLLYNLKPSSDHLGVFIKTLQELTNIRKYNKEKLSDNISSKSLLYIQEDFKTLSNTYYGYLAYYKGLFNDYDKANEVSEMGQEILKKIIFHLRSQNCTVIEVDTDGVFFIPPYKMDSDDDIQQIVSEINKYLPEKINLIIGGKYKKFLSYKKKNYAVLKYDDKIQIKGSALISKNLEKFGKIIIQKCINCILREDYFELHAFYKNLYENIVNHKWSVQDFAKVETLKDPLYKYSNEIQRDQRNRNAAYELAIKSGLDWNVGDKVAYYITGKDANVKVYENCKFADEWDPNFPDENTAYYLKKVEEFINKFAIYFSKEDFDKIFSLTDYKRESFKTIRLLSVEVSKDVQQEQDERDELEYKIWLADEE